VFLACVSWWCLIDCWGFVTLLLVLAGEDKKQDANHILFSTVIYWRQQLECGLWRSCQSALVQFAHIWNTFSSEFSACDVVAENYY
jgi:hypothetical protein